MKVENEFLTALLRCRLMTEHMAIESFGLTAQEIESLVSEGLLDTQNFQVDERVEVFYSIQEEAEKRVKERVGFQGEMYRGFIELHDMRLMSFYLQLSPVERKSWNTRDDMTKQYRLPGTIDGSYTNKDGVLEGVEVLSKTAKPSAVEKAENFLKQTPIKKMNYLMY